MSEEKLSDEMLLESARLCLEHALKSLAIRDCNCAACKGFMSETPELVALLRKRLNLEPKK